LSLRREDCSRHRFFEVAPTVESAGETIARWSDYPQQQRFDIFDVFRLSDSVKREGVPLSFVTIDQAVAS
jgi:hypothetical protein